MLLMLGDKSTKSVTKKGVSQQKSVLLLCLYAYLRTWILANQQNHKKMERNITHCLKKRDRNILIVTMSTRLLAYMLKEITA